MSRKNKQQQKDINKKKSSNIIPKSVRHLTTNHFKLAPGGSWGRLLGQFGRQSPPGQKNRWKTWFVGHSRGLAVAARNSIFAFFYYTFFEHHLGDLSQASGCHCGPFRLPFCFHFKCPRLQKWSPKCILIFNTLKNSNCIQLYILHGFYNPQGCTNGFKMETKSFQNWGLLQDAFLKLFV